MDICNNICKHVVHLYKYTAVLVKGKRKPEKDGELHKTNDLKASLWSLWNQSGGKRKWKETRMSQTRSRCWQEKEKREKKQQRTLCALYEDINKDMVKMIKGCNVQRESMREGRVLAESDVIYVQRNITKAAESFVNRIFFLWRILTLYGCMCFLYSLLFVPSIWSCRDWRRLGTTFSF